MPEFLLVILYIVGIVFACYLLWRVAALLNLLEVWIARKKRDLESDKGDRNHA